MALVEKILIYRLKIADVSAFTYIFTIYYNDLVIFARRFTKEQDSAEEIVQDSFAKLWEEHETLNITISLRAYLYKTVHNRAIDLLRHKKVIQSHVHEYSQQQSVNNTDSYALRSELENQVEATLCRLPAEISESFRMNRYKGLRYHEIAKLKGVSVRTIEVHIGKALTMLRSQLKEYI